MKSVKYDYVVIGAGIFGLYLATKLSEKHPKKKIIVLEYDHKPFQRASFINQARVHNGYHYPRSLSTALKSASYYNRFIKDYSFAINKNFKKIYAISSSFSYANSENFQKFCSAAKIPCKSISQNNFFKKNVIEEAFLTEEHGLDSVRIMEHFISIINKTKNLDIKFNSRIKNINKKNDSFFIKLHDMEVSSPFVVNSSYASLNQILNLFEFNMFKLKYELAEIALCNVSKNIAKIGITIMDGPFCSLMPFGFSGLHSISAVHYTPHKTCESDLPNFDCQNKNLNCNENTLDNCNLCVEKPQTNWSSMHQLAKKYFKEDIKMNYVKSLYAVKAILKNSELSDSRPTVIKEFSKNPTFISVLSGKFNTIYDLDEIIKKY